MRKAFVLSGKGVWDHLRGDKCLALRNCASLYVACFSISQFLVNTEAEEQNQWEAHCVRFEHTSPVLIREQGYFGFSVLKHFLSFFNNNCVNRRYGP